MIRIGPAGGGLSTPDGIRGVASKGLGCLEVEFTYGVRFDEKEAAELGHAARESGIQLSVHAPYFINLASLEEGKVRASMKRIADSALRGEQMGARYVVFHAGFYQGRKPEDVMALVSEAISKVQERLEGKKIALAPETTGKPSQFGDLDELIRLRDELGTSICVDFAHLLARNGSVDYDEVLSKLKGMRHIHSHFSGIEFGDKGEKRHKLTGKREMQDLISALLRSRADISVINESPDPLGDALRMLDTLKRLSGTP